MFKHNRDALVIGKQIRPRRHTPFLVGLMKGVEDSPAVDRFERAPQAVAGVLLSSPRSRAVLHGDWLGHAVHPLLTDLPLGAWTATTVLDLTGGEQSRPAAQKLLAFGLLTAVPTAVTGLAEWGSLAGSSQRRVGVVHAYLNTVALGMYGASFAARRRHRHRLGVVLAIGGGLTATASGYLGGHMTLARKVSSRHPAFEGPA